MNIIEKAVLKGFRFPSSKGMLTVSQIAELPLQSKTNISLDSVAIGIQTTLDSAVTKSFVTESTAANAALQEQLEVVKHVIAYRLSEKEKAKNANEKSSEKQRLLSLLASIEKKEDESKTKEEVLAMLASL